MQNIFQILQHEMSGDFPTVGFGRIPSLNGFQLLFRTRLNSINRLPLQTSCLRDCTYRNALPQEVLHKFELFKTERRLPSPAFCPIIIRLGVSYPGFLRFFDDFRLGLSHCRNEPNESIADGLLHWVGRGPIERHTVDNRLNPNLPPNEFPDGVGHVGIVSP